MVAAKLNIQGLDLFYGDQQALKNVSLSINESEVTALIGPSGCGKSTFLRTLNRMNDLYKDVKIIGKVELDGENIYDPRTDLIKLRRRIGMVFQKPNPFPATIYQNVCYGPRLFGVKDKSKLNQIVETSLKQAALWEEVKDRLHQSAYALSGGQQQRLCVARVLAAEPEVILMDEPTSALDPASTMRIEDLIQQLKQNYTIVIVTHNMQQAARISSRTAFFLHGEIVEADETETVFTSPRDKRTEDYITGRFG